MQASHSIDQLAAQRALDSLPVAWVDLAYGRVSADEASERAREVGESEALIAGSRVLFGPSTEQDERLLAQLLDQHFPQQTGTGSGWRQGLVVLLAASLLLVLMPYLFRGGSVPAFEGEYEMTLERAYRPERGAQPQAANVYVEGRKIGLRLQPGSAVSENVGVKLFAASQGRHLELNATPNVFDGGVIEIVESTDDLGLSVGTWQLTVVVGPSEHLPHEFPQVKADDEDAPYDVMTAQIEIVPAEDPPPS